MNSGSQSFIKATMLVITLNAMMLFIFAMISGNFTTVDQNGNTVPSLGAAYMGQDLFGAKAWARDNKESQLFAPSLLNNVVYGAIEATVNFVLFIGLFFKMLGVLLFGAGYFEKIDGTTVGLFIASILNFIVMMVNIFYIREVYRIFSGK